MSLRVLAIAAPDRPGGAPGELALTSADPASLYNAVRLAAWQAERGTGPWAASNWNVARAARRQYVRLLHSLEGDGGAFDRALLELRPNLLLIGAMSLCLPGAIACAARAKQLLGDEVCVVLGGRHATETVYAAQRFGGVRHHASSPLRLMAQGAIPAVFDLVVSGEGEHVVVEIGNAIARLEELPAARAAVRLDGIAAVPGRWILGRTDGDAVRTVVGKGPPLNHDAMPPPCEMFGVGGGFDVFEGRLTAHVFSDSGPGCVYDCAFCSERRSVVGPMQQMNTAVTRLVGQLRAAHDVIAEDAPGRGASAFVEDSVLLGGSKALLRDLARTMRSANLDLRFGAQLTIDQILARTDLLGELRQAGLDYLFVGVETLDPTTIGGMSKDTRAARSQWVIRTEQMFATLAGLGISCGAALLFGLGEPHDTRLELLEYLARWRRLYGEPSTASINWAVQHPLRGDDGGTSYLYREWGTPSGPFLQAFRHFGEFSVRYPLAGQAAPELGEVMALDRAYSLVFSPPEGIDLYAAL